MAISLSPESERLLQDRMELYGLSSADELVQRALEALDESEFGEVDEETRAAIEEGLAQADRGEGRPWEDVRSELMAKYFPTD